MVIISLWWSWCKYGHPHTQAKLALIMPIDEPADRQQCSLETSNTVSPFDISPTFSTKKQAGTRRRKAASCRLVGWLVVKLRPNFSQETRANGCSIFSSFEENHEKFRTGRSKSKTKERTCHFSSTSFERITPRLIVGQQDPVSSLDHHTRISWPCHLRKELSRI